MHAPTLPDAGDARDPTRRDVLRRAAAGAALAALAPGAAARPAPRLGTLIGPGSREDPGGTRNVLSLLDLDRTDEPPARVELDFFGHGVAFDPLDPDRIALFEKRGRGACEIDLARRAVTRPIESSAGREFYGHGVFSSDGALLYATETVVDDDYRGVIVVRDGRTLEELGELPSHGESPHDCVLRDGGATLAITHGGSRRPDGGSPPGVTWVDLRTQELLERVEIPDPDVGAGHLALGARGDLVVVSAGREWMPLEALGAVSLRPAGGDLVVLEEPPEITARLRGEALSVALHEPSGIAAVTHPRGCLVTFWDVPAARFVRALDLAFPRGVALTLDASRFVLSYGHGTSLLEVSTETLEPVPGSRRTGLDLRGSHVVVRPPGSARPS